MLNCSRVLGAVAVMAVMACAPQETPLAQCGGQDCAPPRQCVVEVCRTTCRGSAECDDNQHCEAGLCTERPARTASSGGADGSASSGLGDGGAGKALGAVCTADGECQFGMCRTVNAGSDEKVCVRSCTQQSDCGSSVMFCNPVAAGSPDGVCVPHSSAHCLACTSNADCGFYSETCTQPGGEGARVCQVDCSLAGSEACPSDYTCVDVTVSGSPRRLCRPNTGACATAEGGDCTHVTGTQACVHSSDAGSCTGTRTCGGDHRFTACSAPAPACKVNCTATDPAGCSLAVCPGVATTPQDCGECGANCPGVGQGTAVVECVNGNACSLDCVGENYDVNGGAADGCEINDLPTGNHSRGTALYVGELGCGDGDSTRTFMGQLPNDGRVHQPPVPGLDVVSGTAPDWFRIAATGGVCQNDVNMALAVAGSSTPDCFGLTIKTDDGDYHCDTDLTGACGISNGSGSYPSDTNLYLVVEKRCSSGGRENPTYSINGHL